MQTDTMLKKVMNVLMVMTIMTAVTEAAKPSSTFTTILNLTEPSDIVTGAALHTQTSSSGPIIAFAGTSPPGTTAIVAPYSVEASSATPLPVHAYPLAANSAFHLRAAEDYDTSPAGDVYVFTADGVKVAGSDSDVCVLKGYSEGADPVWTVSLKGCGLVFGDAFAVSQDGATVVLGYLHAGNGPVIVGIDGQTGHNR